MRNSGFFYPSGSDLDESLSRISKTSPEPVWATDEVDPQVTLMSDLNDTVVTPVVSRPADRAGQPELAPAPARPWNPRGRPEPLLQPGDPASHGGRDPLLTGRHQGEHGALIGPREQPQKEIASR